MTEPFDFIEKLREVSQSPTIPPTHLNRCYYTDDYKPLKEACVSMGLRYDIVETATNISCYKWSVAVEQVSAEQHKEISKLI